MATGGGTSPISTTISDFLGGVAFGGLNLNKAINSTCARMIAKTVSQSLFRPILDLFACACKFITIDAFQAQEACNPRPGSHHGRIPDRSAHPPTHHLARLLPAAPAAVPCSRHWISPTHSCRSRMKRKRPRGDLLKRSHQNPPLDMSIR